ncbi:TolC family outer membrane protein [Neomegalonema sp.]|uniref:TolC family outer membrane protein n=1 Tax=Neomegalonema sp. TaxID=2039713 RepID=UPI002613D7D1|nr:TolC family outer membrane protein [Neomegalonema sp.]MDD2867096.1 TolC family outer membrane protein [Neomegalonema sp.]
MRRWTRWTTALALTAGVFAGLFATPSAQAETLYDALSDAYRNNPSLAAGRFGLQSAAESLTQARLGYSPSLNASGSYGVRGDRLLNSGAGWGDSLSASLSASLPVYDGGRTAIAIRQAAESLDASQLGYLQSEQSALLDTVVAYVTLVRDRELLGMTLSSFEIFRQQSEAARLRFEVGEATLTDVAQAEAQLSSTRASVVQARGALTISEQTFRRLVGRVPDNPQPPSRLPTLPSTLDLALSEAMAHPSILAARAQERAAIAAAESTMTGYMPTVGVSAGVSTSKSDMFPVLDDFNNSANIGVSINHPIYDGGVVDSRVRAARATASQRRMQIMDAEAAVRQSVGSAFTSYVTAQQSLAANLARVQAAQLAYTGVSEEMTVGARSVLDQLNAQQSLLDARTALVRAAADSHISAYRILGSMGRLSPTSIGLSRISEPIPPTPTSQEIRRMGMDAAVAMVNRWNFPWNPFGYVRNRL